MKKVLVVDDQAGWRKFNSETIFTILGNAIYYMTQFIPELHQLVEENTKNDYLI